MSKEKRLAVIAITIESPGSVQGQINALISNFSSIVIGRMGIPYHERNVAVLALIVDGREDEINSLTGQLGKLSGVSVRVAMTKK